MKSVSPVEPEYPVHVAIVGAGPSGCYTALALRKLMPAANISIFDTRPSPFGLVRYGVAPDHQGMKAVSRQFERLLTAPGVEYFGGVTIGDAISLEDLTTAYHAVVMATGLSTDRPLGIPTDPSATVLGAGSVMRYLNADLDGLRGDLPGPQPLGTDVAIVGAGNVALDVARLLAKTDEELIGSDIDDDAHSALAIPHVRTVRILGRGQRENARWDAAMLTELCSLSDTAVWIDGANVAEPVSDSPIKVLIEFSRTPARIDFKDGRTVLVASDTDEPAVEYFYPVDTVITATGFVAGEAEQPGHIDVDGSHHIVRIGGCASGTLGNLSENRTLAKSAAAEVLSLVDASDDRIGADQIRERVNSSFLSFDDWAAVDAEEVRRAGTYRARRKLSSRGEIDDVVRAHRSASSEQAASASTNTPPSP